MGLRLGGQPSTYYSTQKKQEQLEGTLTSIQEGTTPVGKAKELTANATMDGQQVATYNQLGYTGQFVANEPGWYRLCSVIQTNIGSSFLVNIGSRYSNSENCSYSFAISYSWLNATINQLNGTRGSAYLFDKIRIGWGTELNTKELVIEVHYRFSALNPIYAYITGCNTFVNAKVEKVTPEMETGYTFKTVDILDSCMAVDGKQVATTESTVLGAKSEVYGNIEFGDTPITDGRDGFRFVASKAGLGLPTDKGYFFTTKASIQDQAFITGIKTNENRMFFKTRYGKWNDWKEVATVESTLSAKQRIYSSNLNEITKPGYYYTNNSSIAPYTYSYVDVYKYDNSLTMIVFATSPSLPLKIRGSGDNGVTWTEWYTYTFTHQLGDQKTFSYSNGTLTITDK